MQPHNLKGNAKCLNRIHVKRRRCCASMMLLPKLTSAREQSGNGSPLAAFRYPFVSAGPFDGGAWILSRGLRTGARRVATRCPRAAGRGAA
jgi:hypothetical protein